MLSGLTHGASLVLAPKTEAPIRHIEFVALGPDRALVVLVTADGQVENRLFTPPAGLTPSAMREAANFLNAILQGRTLGEMRDGRRRRDRPPPRRARRALARADRGRHSPLWAEERRGRPRPADRARPGEPARGHRATPPSSSASASSSTTSSASATWSQLLELTEGGEGVRVFIGSENKLFSLSGSSLVVSPYMNADRRIIGAVGVIGPTRLNYGRIVPIVDYTAQLVGRLVSSRG